MAPFTKLGGSGLKYMGGGRGGGHELLGLMKKWIMMDGRGGKYDLLGLVRSRNEPDHVLKREPADKNCLRDFKEILFF